MNQVAQAKLVALTELGIAVGLVAPRIWRPANGLFAGQTISLEQDNVSLAIYPARVIRSGHIASFFYEPGLLLSAILRFRPDVVQVEQEVYSFAAAQAVLSARVLMKKAVVFGWENLDRRLHVSQRLARRVTLAIADAVIVGNSAAAQLIRSLGFSGPVTTMPQIGVDPIQFNSPDRGKEDHNRIGFVGRMVPEKGGDILLLAFAELAGQNDDLRLQFVGSGPEKSQWQRLSQQLGIADQVSWLDTVPHERVPSVMAELDILVLPSRSTPSWKEQFGLVLVQAMSMGVPVVGANSGAIPEVIGREDLIFNEGDHMGLAKILERLGRSKDWRRSISQWGRRRVTENFTNQAIAERLMNLYRELLGAQE